VAFSSAPHRALERERERERESESGTEISEYSELRRWNCRANPTSTRLIVPRDSSATRPLKLRLIRVRCRRTPPTPSGESYDPRFSSPPTFARGRLSRSVSTAVTFSGACFRCFPLTPSYDGPILHPWRYLNSRSTLSQVRSARSVRSFVLLFPGRRFIAGL
jgi:hypothetical protein